MSVFSPVIGKIENLVSRQVDTIQEKYHKAPKYLRWTAICRGAVVQGLLQHNPGSSLGINVETRIARMSYGIICSVPFIEGWHDKRDKEWDDSEQRFEASNQMRWFLREVST
ncbi:hypothetical protein ACHAP7_000294 [Fusarium lateritium]